MNIWNRIAIQKPPSTGTGGTTIIQAGDVDQTISLGSGNFVFNYGSGRLAGLDLGSEAFAMPNIHSGSGVFAIGNENWVFSGQSGIGTETGNLGASNLSGTNSLVSGISITGGIGTGNLSVVFSATGQATGFASRAGTAGTSTWSNTGNAADADDDEAFLSGVAGTLTTEAHNGTMFISGFKAPYDTPAGWTKNKVQIFIKHRWDNTVGLLSSASYTVNLLNRDGSTLQTLENRSTNDSSPSNGGVLILSGYDVTSVTTGLSPVNWSGLAVSFNHTSNILALGGDAGAFVAYVHLVVHYQRSLIP